MAAFLATVVSLAGCGEETDRVSANDVRAQGAVAAVAVYCAEPESDQAWKDKERGVADLLRLLRDDPDAAREEAKEAAGMLDDCGGSEEAARLDRAVERAN